jgi:hypothetical protein
METSNFEERKVYQMFRARLVSLSLVVAVSALGVLTVPASAAIRFEWKEGGGLLGAGESREFAIASDGSNFDLNGSVAGSQTLILSHELLAEHGAKIIGGKAGTGEVTIIFKGVTVDKPTKCVVESEGSPAGTVKTNLLKMEIVESEETGEPLILFTPKTGTVFLGLLLLDKSATEPCVEKNALESVTGSLLASPLPSLAETLNGDLDLEAPTKNFVLSNNTLDKAGLVLAGNVASLTGLVLLLLTNDEKYGAF